MPEGDELGIRRGCGGEMFDGSERGYRCDNRGKGRGRMPLDLAPTVAERQALCRRVTEQGRCEEGGSDRGYDTYSWNHETGESRLLSSEIVRRCRHGNMTLTCPHYRHGDCNLRETAELIEDFIRAFELWIEGGCNLEN